MAIQTLLNHSNVKAAGFGDVFLNVWLGPPTVEAMAALGDAEASWIVGRTRIAALTILTPEMGWSISDEAKAEAAKITTLHKDKLVAQATVLEESGFRASLARSVVSALEMMTRSSYESEVFKDLDQACQWIGDRLGIVDAAYGASLRQAIDELHHG